MIIETSNEDILADYFTGRYIAYIDYVSSVDEPIGDKKRFILDVMSKLDPFVDTFTSEQLAMYVDKSRTHQPFTHYYSKDVPKSTIVSLTKKLNQLVRNIPRPDTSVGKHTVV
ncbi:hypothetical protein [Leuconostoc mesenteroides]|uniref:hypothetical protein n=1 Tax=Leuconostoc mesenteroides TaxID=1245 RepID=UPI0023631751|nr:hypothetical protein [Leuconostoc mesenteroides]